MIAININMYPKDGYRFKDANGTLFVGQSWLGVMKKVENYRRRAKLPPGNPEAEVTAYACKLNPSYCSEENEATIRARKTVSLKGRVLAWLNLVRRAVETHKALKFVEQGEAKARAGVCVTCAENVGLPEGCASCRATLTANRKLILGGSRLIDSRLNGCAVTGEDLPTSVWLDQQRAELPSAPGHCWRKRTL
jgi:hypothetical protein